MMGMGVPHALCREISQSRNRNDTVRFRSRLFVHSSKDGRFRTRLPKESSVSKYPCVSSSPCDTNTGSHCDGFKGSRTFTGIFIFLWTGMLGGNCHPDALTIE